MIWENKLLVKTLIRAAFLYPIELETEFWVEDESASFTVNEKCCTRQRFPSLLFFYFFFVKKNYFCSLVVEGFDSLSIPCKLKAYMPYTNH